MGIESIEGVERCLTVLRAINEGDGLTISSLAHRTELPRAAVNRFVVSLVELGYVYCDTRTLNYYGTSKTLELSMGASRDVQLRKTVWPSLQKTCRDIGWSLNFSTIRSAQLTLIANTDSISPLMRTQRSNSLMRPLIGRAGGHVLLAFLSDAIRADVLAMAQHLNPMLYEDADLSPDQIAQNLADVRTQGYAVTSFVEANMNTVALPIHVGDAVPFSVSASAYASAIPPEKLIARLLKPLQACSQEISRQLKGVDTMRWLPALEKQSALAETDLSVGSQL